LKKVKLKPKQQVLARYPKAVAIDELFSGWCVYTDPERRQRLASNYSSPRGAWADAARDIEQENL
jgi:hypothetical protein